jgi:hypothetical protein
MNPLPHRRRSLLTLLAAALAAAGFAAPAANAGPLVASAASCGSSVLEQPFLPWLDPATYVLAPNGGLERGAKGWELAGASVVSGNEPYYVHDSGDSHALRLPAGSTATTQAMCVGIDHPTLRFFARNAGSSLSTLKVEVLYEDAAGNVSSLEMGNLAGDAAWQLSPQMPVLASLLPLLPDERTAVAFRFTNVGGGDWRVDDVYVDPFFR